MGARIKQSISSRHLPLRTRTSSFTRNFGKEAALFAGLEHATGEAAIPIDVDLQDPIDLLPVLIDKWQAGAEVVLAKRIDRSADTAIKRGTARLLYKIHNKICRVKIEHDVGDFRLMSREVVDSVLAMPERNLFMKGIFSWVGGTTEVVHYKRSRRSAGCTKFNCWKLWDLALEGITSFSTAPLRVWTYIGLGIATVAFFYAAWMVADKLIWGNPVPGYPSVITIVLFLGGIQLIGIGILGEYIGRIYIESKKRPRYILKKRGT